MIFNGPFQLGCRYFIQLTVVGGPLGRKNQLISAVYLRIDSLLAKLLELPVQCMENPFAEKMSVVGHKVQSSKFKNQSKVQGPRSKVQKHSSEFQVQSSKFKNQSKVQGPKSKNPVQSFKFKAQSSKISPKSKVQGPKTQFKVSSSKISPKSKNPVQSSKFKVQETSQNSKFQTISKFQTKRRPGNHSQEQGFCFCPPTSSFRPPTSGFWPLASGL